MLAAAFVVVELSALQLGASIAIVFAAIALTWLLGLDEGRYRERAALRRFEAEQKIREQVAQEQWVPPGRRHRS